MQTNSSYDAVFTKARQIFLDRSNFKNLWERHTPAAEMDLQARIVDMIALGIEHGIAQEFKDSAKAYATRAQAIDDGKLDALADYACDACGVTPGSDMRVHAQEVAKTAIRRDRARNRNFQGRLSVIHKELFRDDPTDIQERVNRFFEEAAELAQALGMTRGHCHELIEYTFGREPGIPEKEVGQVAVTLASICIVAGLDLVECAEADLKLLGQRSTIERIKAKRATRHGRGSLPGIDPAPTSEATTIGTAAADLVEQLFNGKFEPEDGKQ